MRFLPNSMASLVLTNFAFKLIHSRTNTTCFSHCRRRCFYISFCYKYTFVSLACFACFFFHRSFIHSLCGTNPFPLTEILIWCVFDIFLEKRSVSPSFVGHEHRFGWTLICVCFFKQAPNKCGPDLISIFCSFHCFFMNFNH